MVRSIGMIIFIGVLLAILSQMGCTASRRHVEQPSVLDLIEEMESHCTFAVIKLERSKSARGEEEDLQIGCQPVRPVQPRMRSKNDV